MPLLPPPLTVSVGSIVNATVALTPAVTSSIPTPVAVTAVRTAAVTFTPALTVAIPVPVAVTATLGLTNVSVKFVPAVTVALAPPVKWQSLSPFPDVINGTVRLRDEYEATVFIGWD
jgi:hypothetical protein